MECVEAALKTSFRKDMAMKFSAQTLLEELTLSSFHVQNVGPCDEFFVDDLLDFSHKEALEEEEEEPEQHNDSSNQSHEICNPDFGFLPTTEPSVPVDDAADLEWLSQFVEDSFSEYSFVAVPAGTSPENPKSLVEKGPEPGSLVLAQPCFETPVPARARSKRTRTGVPVWPLGSPSFTESSSSSTTSSSSSSPSSPLLIYTNMTQIVGQGCLEASPPEKKEKKTAPKGEGPGAALVPPRRCSHCGVQKTPQWRTGPLGAKALCNACGVRYKSGRLLPEYRPACSPTFSSELHSNHHRKVLEMRRNKEVAAGPETGLAPPSAAPSF